MDFQKNYYKILGVKESATAVEIKLAYRRLAVRYHPDRNPNNPEYEEITKELNEAKEVLLNEGQRFIYDEYRRKEQEINSDEFAKKQKQKEKPKTNSQRTVVRTSKVVTEIRIYITGTIFIKYAAPQDMERIDSSLRESYYLLQPTEVSAVVYSKDCIWAATHPLAFANVFEAHPVFSMSIPYPVSTLLKDGEMQTNYLLNILELRVLDPQVTMVTKHENSSYGTVTGQFYGYIKDFEEHEVTESFVEKDEPIQNPSHFSGPTGNFEEKFERGAYWKRYENFYRNGTTFWGKWQPVGSTKMRKTHPVPSNPQNSCINYSLSILFSIFLIVWVMFSAPYIIPLIIFYFLLGLLSHFFNGRKGGSIVGVLVFLFYIVAMISLLRNQSARSSVRNSIPQETVREKYPPQVKVVRTENSSLRKPDSVVTRFRQWTDYSGNEYAGNYTYHTSQVRAAADFKRNFSVNNTAAADYDRMIHAFKENDATYMDGAYHLFDSLKIEKKLSQVAFAEMIMSFVQDIPYSLVLDQACDASAYNDAFISKYLSSTDALCNPYQRFGIYTPIEFLAHVSGDCDTRTLFSYLILSHYGYDVALLSSEAYRHSLIGINLPYRGKAYEFGKSRYVLWETTVPQARPGILPAEISNMRAWRISLLNKL